VSELDRLSNIQWFPGHMTKTLRVMQSELKNVDMVIELLDARIPGASKNPELERMSAGKPRLLILNKADIADPEATKRWEAYYRSQGYGTVAVSSHENKTVKVIYDAIHKTMADKVEALENKGMVGARIRAMVVGVPNVGKSTIINRLAGTQKAKVEDRPGVTRGKQWVTLDGVDLLDMPGVLWPKFESMDTAVKLALTGAIKDQVLNIEELAAYLLGMLRDGYKDALCKRYKLPDELPEGIYDLLEMVARKRGMLISRGEVDWDRVSVMVLDEFRACKLGRITLEEPGK